VVGIDSNTFELRDELSNYFSVRHPAPDWRGLPRLLRNQGGQRLIARLSPCESSTIARRVGRATDCG